jgi:hypothetical protein
MNDIAGGSNGAADEAALAKRFRFRIQYGIAIQFRR